MIKLSQVSKTFKQKNLEIKALKDVSATFMPNKITAIVGPSGSGKSTLLRILSGLEPADIGEVIIDDAKFACNKSYSYCMSQKVGMVFQQYHLFPDKTVLENVTLALRLVKKLPAATANEIAIKHLQQLGLIDKITAFPANLSGGQQQRVAIARALALEPKILLFDEPTAALDPEMTQNFIEIVQQLAEKGLTIVMVTHDMELVRKGAHKILFLDNGELLGEFCPTKFFVNPTNSRVAQFVKAETTT